MQVLFEALLSKDYDRFADLLKMFDSVNYQRPVENALAFSDCRYAENEFTLLHAAVGQEDMQALEIIMKQLDKEVLKLVINDQENHQKWTPLLLAA